MKVRYLLKRPGALLVRLIFAFVGFYFTKVQLHQRVWVRGETEDLGVGHAERWSIREDEWSQPVGLKTYIRMVNDPQRLLVVDLTELKWDGERRQWHFYRPGTPDPNPRIPRDG